MIETSAINFYQKIEPKNRNNFKLVNGSFIVRCNSDGTMTHIADFYEAKSVLNERAVNIIRLNESEHKQLFRKEKGKILTHNRMDIQAKYPTMNFWKPLTIGFNEKPIEDILSSKQQEVSNG